MKAANEFTSAYENSRYQVVSPPNFDKFLSE